MSCPDQECHDKVVRFSFLTKILGGSVGLLVVIMISAISGTIGAERTQNEKLTKIPVIEQAIKSIEDDVKKLNRNVEKITREMQRQINRDDLNRLIEEIKNGKK